MALNVKVGLIGVLDMLKFKNMAKVREQAIQAAPAKEIKGEFAINQNAKLLHPDHQKLVVSEVIVHDAAGAKTYVFRSAENKPLAYFRAGQYLSVKLQIGDSFVTRPYSISSSPKWATEGKVAITVRTNPGGFVADWLLENLKEGDTVIASAGEGQFYYENLRDAKNVVALAGGSGITPFLSMAYAIRDGIEDFNLTIEPGKKIALVGASGCGKSTILSILARLEDKTSGNVNFKDNLSIGYMLQDDCLLPFKTILDNCLIGLDINNKLTEENKKYVINLLTTYGLGDFINSYPSNLSGGMRQRVALIRTLAIKPDILLLDEALSALDYQSRLAISDDLYKIIKQEGKTAIMVTHDISEAISMSDKVIVLTKRPAKVKNIYEIKYNNKSTPMNNRKEPEFTKYFDLIWNDLNDF